MSFGAVDLLARLQLEARRRGVDLRLRDLAPGLRDLVSLSGLEDALRVEPRRQPEEREQRRRVEEEGQLGDPAV
jgi:hypothetical protein